MLIGEVDCSFIAVFHFTYFYLMKTALITGVTSGFGRAFALRLAKLDYKLIITGRRAERLHELACTLREEFSVQVCPLCFDVRDNEACRQAIASIPEEFREIDELDIFGVVTHIIHRPREMY